MVLGRMTARVDAFPVVGEEHVVVGRHAVDRGPQVVHRQHPVRRRRPGRGHRRHIWIQVDPAVFN